ncbi:MAG TPA: alpha/beta hydrolase, partial [Fimbriimonadaceae bacterium]|nr:alpha/beta hydrolase [Fimbriimonadaceae bacterium]
GTAPSALLSNSAGPSPGGTFDSNGVRIRYVSEGTGEAVVLIHGWLSDATMWGRDAKGNPKLTPVPGFQVVALDCRGHGKSDKPHEAGRYGAEMAADVVRLLDHLKIKKAHLIGYSMGAFIAGKVVAGHPDRVLSVIYGGQAPLLKGEAGSKEIEVFAKAVENGKGMGPYLNYVRPELDPAVADGLAKMMYEGKDLKAWALAGLSFSGLEVKLEEWKRFLGRSLFVYGSKEVESTQARVANLIKQIASAEVKVVEGGDHITTLSKPSFRNAIAEFLKSQKGIDYPFKTHPFGSITGVEPE